MREGLRQGRLTATGTFLAPDSNIRISFTEARIRRVARSSCALAVGDAEQADSYQKPRDPKICDLSTYLIEICRAKLSWPRESKSFGSAKPRAIGPQPVRKAGEPFDRLVEDGGVLCEAQPHDMARPFALEQGRDRNRRHARLADRPLAEAPVVDRDPRRREVDAKKPGRSAWQHRKAGIG